jgi:hypothetical protein
MFNLVSQAHNCGMVKDLLGILSLVVVVRQLTMLFMV